MTQFFISRSGADSAIALHVEAVLREAGATTIIQDLDFQNHSFMERMHAGLKSGAKLVALLSPTYLTSDHCEAEWMNPLTDDPLNKSGMLTVLRVKPSAPVGLLRSLAYVDLVPLLADPVGNHDLLREAILASVAPGRRDIRPEVSQLFYAPRAILHPDIKPLPGFTGRGDLLAALDGALWPGNDEGPAKPFVLKGMPGVGKSTLARTFAYEVSGPDAFAGIWWMNAEKEPGADAWPGIETGLVGLWDALYPGDTKKRDARTPPRDIAKGTLRFLEHHGSERPWLLVWDNLDDPRALRHWQPPANVRLLITTRRGDWSAHVRAEEVTVWTMPEAIAYLRAESGRVAMPDADAGTIVETLGRLPLAISHAAATLRARTSLTPTAYLARLAERMSEAPDGAEYDKAVFATFTNALAVAEQDAPGARAVLQLAAFFAPDDIPETLFQQAAEHYPAGLQPVVADTERLGAAIDALDRLSLIDFAPATRTLSVHRLVQAAARAGNSDEWGASAVDVCNAAYPGDGFEHWVGVEGLLPHARAAAALAHDDLGEPLAVLLARAGFFLDARGAYDLAEPLFKRDLAISEKALGPDHPDVGTSLNNLAGLYEAQGQYDLAEPLYQRSNKVFEASLGAEHPNFASSLNNLAGLYRAQGKFDLAEPLYQRTLSIFEKALGPDHPDVGQSLNNLAALYQAQGQYDLAEPLYKRSLRLREKALGPDHPDVGTSLNNLAGLYEAQGQYDLAEPLYQRALAVWETALGPDHPSVGTSLNNLAALYQTQGQYELAEPLYQRTLSIFEKALGPDHPLVGTSLNNLAALYEAQGKYDLAEPLYQRTLSIFEKALGPDHPLVGTSLNNLAELYRAQGQYDLAEPLYKRSLAIREKALGPDHPDVGASLNNLALLYKAQGQYDLAEPLYQSGLAISEKALGPDHPNTAMTVANLADLLAQTGRLKDAVVMARRALAAFERALGAEHPHTKGAAGLLAAIEGAM